MTDAEANSHPDAPRRAAEKIVRVLREAGHVAYFAGGCVRDMLLGVNPKDYDVATDAPPDRVRALFRRARPVGEAFGVVLVRMMKTEVEVATFRTESGYSDGRRPDEVNFTDAEHDARRRDFTINGIFYDPLSDTVHDWVGGRDDIAAGLIRAIGDPQQRFAEDFLRMMRAVRFAARLAFRIEPTTKAAILDHAGKLSRISRERIGMELQAMFAGPHPAQAVALLTQTTLDGPTLTERTRPQPTPVLDHLNVRAYPALLAAWAIDRHLPSPPTSLLQRLGMMKPIQIVERWRAALTLSNADADAMEQLLTGLPTVLRWAEQSVASRKRLAARDDWAALHGLAMSVASVHGEAERVAPIEDEVRQMSNDGIGLAPPPLITGDDLIAAGLKPGPQFRKMLDATYDAQLEGRVTDHAAAIRLAQQSAAR